MRALVWFLQRLTGLFLLAGLIVHFWIMHYSGSGQLQYEHLLARLQSPWWRAFDLGFLVFAVFHGLNGLSGILVEYIKNETLAKTLKFGLLVIAILTIVIGSKAVTV